MGGDPMPLIRYFVFVGTGLVLLLIGLGWCFPQPTAELPGSVSNGPTIRIASAERLPERVVIDTSLPTIVPPTTVVEFAERWPQTTVADVSAVANPSARAASSVDVIRAREDLTSGFHKMPTRERFG